MSKIVIPNRFLFDSHFYTKVLSENRNEKLLMKLMYINACTKGMKKQQNCMSKKVFNDILTGKQTLESYGLLRASFFPIDEPKPIEEIEDEIVRNIKYAVKLAEGGNSPTIIFTSDDMLNMYQNNPHFTSTKDVTAKSGKDAIRIIEKYANEIWDIFDS